MSGSAGWSNHPTRLVWLHLTSNESSYQWLRHVASTLTRDAACAVLSAAILNTAENALPGGSLEFDLLRWAVSSVNFEEIVSTAREQEEAA